MGGNALILIGSTTDTLEHPVVKQVLAAWDDAERPKIELVGLDGLVSSRSLPKGAAAWAVLESPDPLQLTAVLDLLHERGTPALLTCSTDPDPVGSMVQAGVTAAPLSTDPAVLASMLKTTWAQAQLVRSLQMEVRMLQLHQGGLCDQIDKMDEELRLAAQLQREFLPAETPSIGQIDCSVLYRPAGYVSGDIYDIVRLDDEHVGFFVADAVGHGVPAALMTMFIKRCLHTRVIDPNVPRGYRIIEPNEALARLNHDMSEQDQAGKMRFATACYGVINCRTLEFRFARAGHPFPLLIHADGTHEEIDAEGALLGIFPEEQFELQTRTLDPGDRLLMFSDGFEFAFPDHNEANGRERHAANPDYTDELKQLAEGTLDEALQRLSGRLDEAAGSLNQRDDLTVICIAVREAADATDIEPMTAPWNAALVG